METEPKNGSDRAAGRSLDALVLDEWLPYPPNTGKRVRTWNLLRRLALRHRISLLCYGESEGEAAAAVRSAGIRVHAVAPLAKGDSWRLYPKLAANLFSRYPYSVTKHYTRRFRERLRSLLSQEHFDLVHCEWTPYARFLRVLGEIPSVIMAHNIESQIWFRRAHQSRTLPERAFSSLQARKMEWFERKALKHRQGIAAVSAEDAEQLRAWGVQGVSLVENGADVDQFMPVREAPHADRILFFASLDWYPNLDSLEYFLKAILPLVVRSRPGARLQVVGKGPAPGLEKQVSGFAGVEFVGEVTDVRPYLAQAAVVVVPLRIGGGSRIKILEALAMGKAVVSTSIGAEGLAVGHGIHLLLADTPADFASRTVDLLTSPQECRRLGGNGRRLVVEHYSWDRAAGALESAWQQACVLEPFCPSSDSAPNRLRAEVIP